MGNLTRDLPDSDLPPQILAKITEFLIGVHSHQFNLREAHLRLAVQNIFPFIILMYGLLIFFGVVSNLAVIIYIIKNKLYKDPTYSLIINNVVSDIVKCVFILPLSLFVLLVQNWLLGELLCSFLPMLQDIPLHVTTLTFVLIALDRYKMIKSPTKPRIPAFVCAVGTWLTSFCLVLPYPIYTIYVDLGKFDGFFRDVGICVYNLIDDMEEYLRGIFVIMYLAPMILISYLYVKSTRQLQENNNVTLYERRHRGSRARTDSHSTTTDFRSNRGDFDGLSQYSRSSYRENRPRPEGSDGHLDLEKEKRTNKYMVTTVTMYAICLCPLMVLRLVKLGIEETYENSGHFDIVFIVFVWIAFLPVCSTPVLFASWQMSRATKERIKGFFRFGNRRLRQSCETVMTTTGTPSGQHRGSHGRGYIGSSREIVRYGIDQPLSHFENDPNSPCYQQKIS